mgnify:CR=1 FL=1
MRQIKSTSNIKMFQQLIKTQEKGKSRTASAPIVIEFGEFSSKAGFSGEDRPLYVSPSTKILYDDETKEKKIFDRSPLFFPNTGTNTDHKAINVVKDKFGFLISRFRRNRTLSFTHFELLGC